MTSPGSLKEIAASPDYIGILAMTITRMDRDCYVYIMANDKNTVTYTGITNNLVRRVFEHKNKLTKGFTDKYKINKLVYYEICTGSESAIIRKNR